MLRRIRVDWKNDSSELINLPEVNVFTCNADGYEVLGVQEEIDSIIDYVIENPDNYTLEFDQELSNDEASEYFDAIRKCHILLGDFDDDQIFGILNAEMQNYTLALEIHGKKRSWSILDSHDLKSENTVLTADFEAFTNKLAHQYAEKVLGASEWVEFGYIDPLVHYGWIDCLNLADAVEDVITDDDIMRWQAVVLNYGWAQL